MRCTLEYDSHFLGCKVRNPEKKGGCLKIWYFLRSSCWTITIRKWKHTLYLASGKDIPYTQKLGHICPRNRSIFMAIMELIFHVSWGWRQSYNSMRSGGINTFKAMNMWWSSYQTTGTTEAEKKKRWGKPTAGMVVEMWIWATQWRSTGGVGQCSASTESNF